MGVARYAIALMVTLTIIANGKELLDEQDTKIEKLLKLLNKPALKSIKTENGDIIDCVPITSQPAFDNPLLENNTILMRPSFIREGDSTHTKKKTKHNTQLWRKNREYCPRNTVPIRRIKKEDILLAKSVERFGKKNHQNIPQDNPTNDHEYAIMNSMKGKYFGTKFTVNLWRPEVQRVDEFSLFQTWLVSQGTDRTTLNTIEAGLQVYPARQGNVNTLRLFVYWTANGYQQDQPGEGCYNLKCPGFVQISNSVMVDGSYDNFVSQYDGDQYNLPCLYASLFDSLKDGATLVQWGGEIINLKTDGEHTTNDMGSGHFPDEGFRKASYFRNIMLFDETNTTPSDAEGIYSQATNDQCYNVKEGVNGTSWGVYFYYGGPGQNKNCP